jgi:uncharacterized protein (TIGR00369 family)
MTTTGGLEGMNGQSATDGPPGVLLSPVDWGDARSKVVAWHDPIVTASGGVGLTGLEFMRAIRDGTYPPAPMASLMGMRIREVELGRVVFECEPDESVYNPIGGVHGGVVCTMADSVIGCAVHTTLELGKVFTSIDLNVSYLRAVTKDSGVLRAIGTVTKPGRRVAFGSAEIIDASGKVVASATGSCLVMDRPPA